MIQLLYRGPSMEELHRDYAKHGRIDDHAPVTTTVEVEIDAPLEHVWDLLSHPLGWPAFDPAIRDVHVEGAVAEDSLFTWTKGKARMTSRFAVVEPRRELTWTGRSSGFNAVHRHLLDPVPAGGTRVRCEESMAGPLLVLFYNRAKMRADLEAWLNALKAAAERP